jgi:hypothetical protein
MLKSRNLLTVLLIVVSAFGLLITGGPVAGAQPITPSISRFGTEATAPMGVMTLPHRTIRHADGRVEQIATPEAVAKVMSATAIYGCGYACDQKDPNSYVFQGSTCSDAETMATVSQGGATAELRYSPRCNTAWSRTCCYVRGGGFGYTGSGVQRDWVYSPWGNTSGSKVWTPMLYDGTPTTFRACFDFILTGTGHDWSCTLKY